MVYYSGSKSARYVSSISNRPNCGGTAKKAGVAPRIGWYLSGNVSLRGAPQKMPMLCSISKVTQTQKTGYRATLGGV